MAGTPPETVRGETGFLDAGRPGKKPIPSILHDTKSMPRKAVVFRHSDVVRLRRNPGCSQRPLIVHFIVRILRTWPGPAAAARKVAAGFRGTMIDRLTG